MGLCLQVDLVLFNTVTNVCSPYGAEKLVRFSLRPPDPLLIFLLSNSRNCCQARPGTCALSA